MADTGEKRGSTCARKGGIAGTEPPSGRRFRFESSTLFLKDPGLMSQSAVVRDYRTLEIGRRRANRLVLTVAG